MSWKGRAADWTHPPALLHRAVGMAVEAGEDGARRYGILVSLVPALSVTKPSGVALALPVEDGIQPEGDREGRNLL